MSSETPGYLTIEGQPVEDAPPGVRRLRLTPDDNQFVDVAAGEGNANILNEEEVTSEMPPFYGETVTRLTLAPGTPMTFTLAYSAPTSEQLDAALEARSLVRLLGLPGVAEMWY